MEEKVDDEQLGEAAWPILTGKDHAARSVFRPEALLREARRQKSLPITSVPPVCVLDPDGDIVPAQAHWRMPSVRRLGLLSQRASRLRT